MTSLMNIEFFGNDFLIEKPTSEEGGYDFLIKSFCTLCLCVCVLVCFLYKYLKRKRFNSLMEFVESHSNLQ